METIAVTPEQGKQIVQRLDDFIRNLEKRRQSYYSRRRTRKTRDGSIILEFAVKDPLVEPEEEEFPQDVTQLRKLSNQVKVQVEQGHVEKKLLIELNEKLGKIQANYGNILAVSATIAAIISGLKDLKDLIESLIK